MADLDIGRLVGYVELDDAGVAQGAQSVKDKVRELGSSGANIAKTAGVGIGIALAAGLVGAMDAEPAQAKLTAQLDLTAGESERIGGVAGRLYSSAYGESLGEVNDALRSVIQNVDGMGQASSDELERISGKVLAVADTFDQDLGGVTRAVGTLLRTGLAKDADEALDIITRGFQNGTNVADDLLDTYTEYGTQFRKLGIDGATAAGILQQGLQGGARDADVVADALKELSIRAVDGSETTAAGFEALGLSGEDMGRRFAAGGASAEAALDLTLDRLRAIPDPIARSQAAVALFGTQAEDLGEALYAIDPSSAVAGLGAFEGAADRVNETVGGTATAKFTAFTRTLKTFAVDTIGGIALPLLTDLGGTLLDVVVPPLELLGTVVGGVSDFFGSLPGPVQATVVVLGGLVALRGPISDTFDTIKGVASSALDTVRLQALYARDALSDGGLGGAVSNAGGKLRGLASGGVAALSGALGGPLGLAIAGVSIGLPILTSLFDDNEDTAEDAARANNNLAQALRQSAGVIDDNVRAAAALEAQESGLLDVTDAAGISRSRVTDAILEGGAAYDEVAARLNDYAAARDIAASSDRNGEDGLREQAETAYAAAESFADLAGQVPENVAQAQQLAEATETSSEATNVQAEASDSAAEAAEAQAEAVDALKDAFDRYNGVAIDTQEQTLNLLDNLADLGEQTATNGAVLDQNTQSGRDNQRAVLDQITGINDLAVATFRSTGNSELARQAWERERGALRNRLIELGYNVEEVDALIAQYGAIPSSVFTDVQANTAPATASVNTWLALQAQRSVTINVRATMPDLNGTASGSGRPGLARGGILSYFADGGLYDPMVGRPLTPMAANMAARVPANTWRVIGDRAHGDEFYLPDDDAPATLAYGHEWARRRGMGLVPLQRFADGGQTTTARAPAPRTGTALAERATPLVEFSGPVSLRDERDAQELAREVDWLQRTRGRRR